MTASAIMERESSLTDLGGDNSHFELQVEWKNSDPVATLKFEPPKYDYSHAFAAYLDCIFSAETTEGTPAKLISLFKCRGDERILLESRGF